MKSTLDIWGVFIKVNRNEYTLYGKGMAFMEYEIVRGPFMLLETVAMVYKYVKGSSFVEAMSRQPAGDYGGSLCRSGPEGSTLVPNTNSSICVSSFAVSNIVYRY